jgi:maltose/moltooligosaccharide transporter
MIWFGLQCTWQFFTLAVARNVFGATSSKGSLFDDATLWAGMCMAVSAVVTCAVAPIMPSISRRFGRPNLLAGSLAVGAVGIACLGLVHTKFGLFPPVALYGIAWAAILAMPYAILSVALPPERNGVYMGLFNLFIVIPQIVYSVGMAPVIKYVFHENPTDMVVLGGICMGIAAVLAMRVVEVTPLNALEPVSHLES